MTFRVKYTKCKKNYISFFFHLAKYTTAHIHSITHTQSFRYFRTPINLLYSSDLLLLILLYYGDCLIILLAALNANINNKNTDQNIVEMTNN